MKPLRAGINRLSIYREHLMAIPILFRRLTNIGIAMVATFYARPQVVSRFACCLLIIEFCNVNLTEAKSPNVLLLCIDDLRPELKSFGVDYIESPNIDRLAAKGRPFSRHYVQAPTCGASRYTLMMGAYGKTAAQRGNGALVARSKNMQDAAPSLPELFRSAGYTTVSIGKVSHHPGGLYGKNWADPDSVEMPNAWTRSMLPCGPWQHPEGVMHGLANGQIRKKSSEMAVFESFEGPDTAYPDGLITETALTELDQLAASDQPFFLAVGIIRPHLPFGAPAKYMRPYRDIELPPIPHKEKPLGKTTWHGSGEFNRYNRFGKNPNTDDAFATEVRKHYAACVTYADALVGRILSRLQENGLSDDTIVVLWGDHGWHLGEHAIWGKHSLFEESLRSPLIVCAPEVEQPGVMSKSVVEAIDLYPTLCDLCGVTKPAHLKGTSLLPILKQPNAPSRTAVAYQNNRETIRTDRYRLIRHRNQGKTVHVELYDHVTDPDEVENIADSRSDVVAKLNRELEKRLL